MTFSLLLDIRLRAINNSLSFVASQENGIGYWTKRQFFLNALISRYISSYLWAPTRGRAQRNCIISLHCQLYVSFEGRVK
jgi:hypothetical protein